MARKTKKLEHDFYLYSMEINPKKPRASTHYSKKEIRAIATDLKEVLGLIEVKVAIVFTVSNIHLSAVKDKEYIKEHGYPKLFTDWHIHASMVSFDYDEIERAVTYIRTRLEQEYGEFPTLFSVSGFNHGRTKEEQEALGYHWYKNQTKNTDYFDIYQREQQSGNNVCYNGTTRAISRTRSFDEFIHNNNMINYVHSKGRSKTRRNANKAKEYWDDLADWSAIRHGICCMAIDRINTKYETYKKTQSEEALQDLQEEINELKQAEALISAQLVTRLDAIGLI